MIVKRIYFLFYTYLISISLATAQNDISSVFDSLEKRSKTQTLEAFNETNKTLNLEDVRIQNQITLYTAKFYLKSGSIKEASTSLQFFWSNFNVSTDSLVLNQKGMAYELQGHLFYRQKLADSSTFYFNKSSQAYLKCNNPNKAFYSLNMASTISYLYGNYFASLKTAYDALELAETYPIKEAMIVDLEIDMGNIYMRLEQYEKTDSLLNSILFNRSQYLSQSQVADIHNNLGLCSFNSGLAKKALYHFKQAESIYLSLNTTKSLSKIYNNLASFYTELQINETKAIEYYKKAIAIKSSLADSSGLSYSYYNVASLFYNIENLDSAVHYGLLAETYSLYDNDNLSGVYYILSKIYEKQHDFNLAFSYANKRGTLLEETIETSVLDAQRLTTEKHSLYLQNKEIELLEKNKELSTIRLNRNKSMLFFIGISFFFLLLVFVLYIRTVKKQQRINRELYERRVSLKSLSSLLKGQEEERKRIAEDLHDGVGSTITLLGLKANELKNKDFINLTTQISTEVREISKNIMPDVIMKLGLQEALIDLSEQFAKSNVILDFVFKVDSEVYSDPQKKLTLYRIIQELTKNAVSHGKANYISVHCEKEAGFINIHFEDNGQGFQFSEEPSGIGLSNIKNRVIYLNGKIKFSSSDQGAAYHIKLPLDD